MAITDRFSYPMRMTRKRSAALIAAVWVCSVAISFPAIVRWRAARENRMPPYRCTSTEPLGYLVFSSTICFYLSLLVMVFKFFRIYCAAVVQTRSLKLGTKQVIMATGELQLCHHHHQHHHSHSATVTSTPEEPEEEPLSALQNKGIHNKCISFSFELIPSHKKCTIFYSVGLISVIHFSMEFLDAT